MLKRPIAGYLVPGAAVALVLAASFLVPSPKINEALASCSSAGISAAPPSPHQPSGTVVVTGTSTCNGGPGYGGDSGIASYRFWVQNPGGAWTIVQDYSSSNTFTWNINGLPAGNYGLEVDVRDQSNHSVSYEQHANTIYTIQTALACGSGTLNGAPPSPSPSGSTITFTATTSACPNPRYRFWVQPPGGMWTIVQNYSTNNKYVWAPPATDRAGSYGVEVDFRDASESVSYDTHVNIAYVLGCTGAGLSANPTSPSYPGTSGTTVVLTATSSCPGTPEYKFWMLPPGGTWTVLRDYAPSNTYNWLVSGKPAGNYQLEADVRDQGSMDTWEAHANISYTLQVPPCTTAGLTAAPPSPGATGATITLTATSSGCITPVYRFWVLPPGGTWTIVQNYSTANQFVWKSPSTGKMGLYNLEVDARDIDETTTYDVVKNIPYQLNGCTVAGLTATPPNTAVHGTGVLLTASSTCPGTPEFRFWVKVPGGNWTIVRDYAAGNTFTYTPATAGSYSFEVDVRDQGSTEVYEKVANINNYTVT
jgi:hypothetical protein